MGDTGGYKGIECDMHGVCGTVKSLGDIFVCEQSVVCGGCVLWEVREGICMGYVAYIR